MKNLIYILTFAVTSFILTGCASMFSQSRYTVSIDSEPSGANVVVVDPSGEIHARITTPGKAVLKSGYKRKPACYSVFFAKNGYEEGFFLLRAKPDSTYYANLGLFVVPPFLVWTAIGMLADEDSGASWELPGHVHVDLKKDKKSPPLSDKEFFARYEKKLDEKLETYRIGQGI